MVTPGIYEIKVSVSGFTDAWLDENKHGLCDPDN